MSTLKTDYILDSAGGNNAQINGVIPVGTANSSIGTAGQVLTSNGAVAYWSTPVTTGKAIAMAIVFGG